MRDIENPMVIDSLWREHEKEQKVIGECPGCTGDIIEGEDVYEFEDECGEMVLIHQETECCFQYVAGKSICKIAGE